MVQRIILAGHHYHTPHMKYQFSYRLPAEALYMALTEDAFYITMEQSVADGSAREAMIRYMDFSMVEAERYGVLLIAADQQSGAAVWSRPLTDEEEEQKSKEAEFAKFIRRPKH